MAVLCSSLDRRKQGEQWASQFLEKSLTLPLGSRWIWERWPSYLNSARNSPRSWLSASGMPSQILASIGLSGTPAARQAGSVPQARVDACTKKGVCRSPLRRRSLRVSAASQAF